MLLLTDGLADCGGLQRALGAIEPCTVLPLAAPPSPPVGHVAIVCDVALDRPAALARTQAVLARHRPVPSVPLLCLSRQAGDAAVAQADAIGATAVLPHTASQAQILFTLRRLIGSYRPPDVRGAATHPALQARVLEAGTAFLDLFGDARRGQPITAASLDRGGDAVLATVAGGRIGAWLDLVRTHDDVTYQHCLLVAGLSAAFSAHLGLSPKGQRLIAQAALVHDIGKANIPPGILNKPGRLSADETALMRTHATVGHDMLVRQGGFDPQLLDIVRHHHEYVDGSGYPDGLRGGRVTPLVRLVTICDIYSALIERRSYKPPTTTRDALAILDGMGGKLDAGLLRTFRDMVLGDG